MSNPVIGQPVQYQSTKGCGEGAFAAHAAVIKALDPGGATVKVFGPYGDYEVAGVAEGEALEPTAGTWNPLPLSK